MNTRERLLVILVSVVAALFVVKGVVGRYLDTLQGYDKQVAQCQKDKRKAQGELVFAQNARIEWLRAGAETLSMDPNEATTRLREELEKLGEKSKLSGVDVVLASTPQRWLRNDIRVLNATVMASGQFEQIVGFLFELHRQPYAVRVKSLTLDQAFKPTRTHEKSTKPGVLKMTAYLDTLILPPCQMVTEITPAVLDAAKRTPTSRPVEVSLAGYKSLLDKKLFQAYEPPAPPIIVGPAPPGPGGKKPSGPLPPLPPVVAQTPMDAMKVLGRLLSSPRGQLAVLEGPNKQAEDEYKEVGDEMYGGTLIFVHPSGAVTEKDGQWRFHALGEQLQSCKPLTEKDQPVVYDELMKLERQATGISARPQ